jgi:hypothetical protein
VKNEAIVIEILNEIDRARASGAALDDLERAIWRQLERLDDSFPRMLAARVENLVQELRALRRDNARWAGGQDYNEDQGADALFNEVTGALGRYLG